MENAQVIEYRPSINEIIVVEQLPVIREQLQLMHDAIEQDINSALSLAVTEETVKEVKAVRAKLKKNYDALEKARIEVKKKILQPYEQFEMIYKECISSIYGPADEKLKKKIDEVEEGLKQAKRFEIQTYFDEYCQSKNIDFVSFEKTGVVVNLSASKKSLKAQVKSFLDKIAEELEFIDTQENMAEILVEYKKSLNVVQAVSIVTRRKEALQKEQERIEQMQGLKAAQTAAAQQVEQAVKQEKAQQAEQNSQTVINEMTSAPTPMSAPVSEPVTKQKEKVLTTRFTVRGTKAQLLALRHFLLEGGYDFE